jgi:signal transduction histidine kinase
MDLQWHLLIRMTAIGLLCWLAVCVAVVIDAGRRSNAELEAQADLIRFRAEQELAWQMTAQTPGYRFPDLSRVAVRSTAAVCMRYQSTDGRSAQWGCEAAPRASTTPAWILDLLERAGPQVPPLRRKVSTWGLVAGTIELVPDRVERLESQWRDIRSLMGLAALIIVALDLLVYWSLGQAFRSTRRIVQALDRLDRPGAAPVDLALSAAHPREFVQIAAGISSLADRLERASSARDFLLSRLIRLQEDERRELAHELHEEFGQCLSALGALSASLRQSVEDGGAVSTPDLQTLEDTVERLFDSLRRLLQQMRPPLSEHQNVIGALQDLVAGWRGRLPGAPRVELDTDGADLAQLRDEQALCLFRIVQECLGNIARHAQGCRTAHILIRHGAQGIIEAQIENDLPAPAAARTPAPGTGMGLRLLAERVRALGGRFEVQHPPGSFRVQAWLPLQRPA